MPIRRSPNDARHPRPQGGRDHPEQVVAINRNDWSQSIGTPGRDRPVRAAQDVYTDCATGCARAVQTFLHMQRVDGPIALFFEQGHKNRHSAYNQIATTIKRASDTLTFGFKSQLPLLQAADLLAWQSCKYAKDYFYPRMVNAAPKRAPRKDFISLMEHPHMFLYTGANGQKDAAGIEIWPLSRRSRASVHISTKETLGLTHWVEDGDTVPIIPVEKTAGWRPGGMQFLYVGFESLVGNKRFAIAFDEPRFFEALLTFLEASGGYEHSQNRPLVSAENVSLDEVSGLKLLSIKLRKGATIAVHLPNDVFEKLKNSLRN